MALASEIVRPFTGNFRTSGPTSLWVIWPGNAGKCRGIGGTVTTAEKRLGGQAMWGFQEGNGGQEKYEVLPSCDCLNFGGEPL